MFKRIFLLILSSFILLGCIAPVFSLGASAPFTFNTSQSQPVSDSTHWNYVVAHDDSDGVLISLESSALQYATFTPSFGGLNFNTPDYPSVAFKCSQSGTYQISLSYYDLTNGYLLSTESASVSASGGYFFWYPDRIFALNSYVTFPVYCYALGSSACIWSSASGYNEVDPFVTWNYSPPDPGPSPDPVDPTSVIRSLIPRPLGTACTFYIADHLYLYSIFVGVPHQFEENGYISSDDPNHFYSDNYNIFDLTFSSSGSSLSFSIKNRAEFSYNVIVTKYDVVDGSFVSSQSHAVTAATNATTPGVSTFSVSLSDPSTYGIYQSGFFARSSSISYPELRISWSDTIDYSLDFFVIRQGLVTIAENQLSIIGGIGSANSTLSSISSTSSSILSQLQSFYTLVDSNFTWFKTTYFNTITNKWDITKTQLDYIILLLEGDGNQTTLPVDSSVASGVDDYVSNENQYMEGFSDSAGDVSSVFNDAEFQLQESSSGFAFVKMIFETFILQIPMTYIIVFFSLTFGIIVMIIGRKVGG